MRQHDPKLPRVTAGAGEGLPPDGAAGRERVCVREQSLRGARASDGAAV